jgi:O-antigen ligase
VSSPFDRASGVPAICAAVLIALLVGAGSTYSPRYSVLAAIGIVLVVITMTNLMFGVVVLTLLSFFERLPGLSGLTLTKPFGLILVISWLLALTQRRERMPLLPRDHPYLTALLVGLVAWALSSVLWAPDPGVALTSATRLALVVVFFLVVYSAVESGRHLLVMAWTFLVGALLISIASLVSGTTVEGRLTGGVLDPNYLAAVLASSIVLASFLMAATRGLARVVLVFFVCTFAITLVLTESRGGLIATGVALAVACFVAGPVRVQTIAVVVVLAATAFTYFTVFAPASLRQRVTDISAQGSASRSDTWQIALHAAEAHPLLGVGLGNFPTVESQYIPGNIDLLNAQEVLNSRLVVHNTYLEVLSELGSVGFLIFFAIVATTLGTAWRGIRQMDAAPLNVSLAARGLFAGTVGLLAAYIFLSGEYEKQLWLLLGLLAAVPTVARSYRVAVEASPSPSPSPRHIRVVEAT